MCFTTQDFASVASNVAADGRGLARRGGWTYGLVT
jgi:hypothetical protein